MKKNSKTTVGIIGFGKMGEAMVHGLTRSADQDFECVGATVRSVSSAREFYGLTTTINNRELVAKSDVIVLAVKPHQAEAVLKNIRPKLNKNNILISICASITLDQLRKWSGGKAAVVRAMPNTPALIGEGITVICSDNSVADRKAAALATRFFQCVGRVVELPESLMDGATGLSGCGPAYVYLMIEALSDAGVKVGIPRKIATELAAQTLKGAAQMVLNQPHHPAALKDEVTTPAGCTIDGLMALEEGKLRVTLIKAVLAAAKKSAQLRG